jgi:hypothetical protein
MGPGRGSEGSAASLGEARESDPAVVEGFPSLDQAPGLQPIDQAGQAAGGHQHPLGQLGHAQGSLGGPGQTEEDVVLREVQVVLLFEFSVQGIHDLVVGVEEGLPRAQLRIGELGGRHPLSIAVRQLHVQGIVLVVFAYANSWI